MPTRESVRELWANVRDAVVSSRPASVQGRTRIAFYYVCIAFLTLLVAVGGGTLGRLGVRALTKAYSVSLSADGLVIRARVPESKLPGPPRDEPLAFRLDPATAQRMIGTDDPVNERWCDVAGNFYSSEFAAQFSYEASDDDGPRAYVHFDSVSDTVRGRVEAHGLKPNFAYQIKLQGDHADPVSYERIGYLGRWRLPGTGTNYTDDDYRAYADKTEVEAYILFDFLVTDAAGNAARTFALDSSLHVLWNADRQRDTDEAEDVVTVLVDASDPAHYARPKLMGTLEQLWAERERARYTAPDQITVLPPGRYRAKLVLTEESFHSWDDDGGYWATVLRLPVEFEITPPPAAE